MDINITYLLILLSLLLRSVRCQDIYLKRECVDNSTCYTLYQVPGTWEQAASYCQSINQRLAVIPDQDTQDVISRFAGSGTGDDRLAWVGGRRSSDTRWRDVNGVVIPIQQMIEVLASGPRWCSGARVTLNLDDDELLALLCQDNLRAVCQLKSAGDASGAITYNISNVWHIVTDARFVSWESARSHCETTYRDGRLAFTHVSGGRKFQPNNKNESLLWVGFHRRPWTWMSPAGLFTYRNWLPMGGVSALGECMGVDLRQDSGWRDAVCEDTNNYFICEGDPTASTSSSTPPHTTYMPTTSEVPTTPMTTSTISKEANTDNDAPTTSTQGMAGGSTSITEMTNSDGEQRSPVTSMSPSGVGIGPPLYYIIGGCAGGVLLIITIVSIVVCCKRRKNKEGKHPKHSVIEDEERGTTEMTAIASTDLPSTKHGTAAQTKHLNGTTESSAGMYSSVRHDKCKNGDKIGVNKDGQLEDGSLKPKDTETSQAHTLPKNDDIYNDAEQVRARKATNKANGVNKEPRNVKRDDESVAQDQGSLHKDPVYDGTLKVKKQEMDASDAEERRSPPEAKAADPLYDDPAEVQVAKLRKPDEREEVGSGSRDSDTEIIDNPLYIPA